MASVPKTTAIAPSPPAVSARNVGPSARVASVSTSQVEALNAGVNISFDTAASGFSDERAESHLGGEGGRRRRPVQLGLNRLFAADTQSFARIFEADVGAQSRNADDTQRSRGHGTPVSRVINTYETNAQVISGTQPIRGMSFSFNL